MIKLRVLDLFSGIGGFSLGLERTGGFETVAFCEIEEFPRRVLAKHWPGVPIYEDVRSLTGEQLAADGIAVDVICGGFPCQDISSAGKGAGIQSHTRSGLWAQICRLAGELRPSFVVVENVAALLSRGLGRVLGDLAALGYDAEWHCIPAAHLGAPHIRDRVWIIAYPQHSDANSLGSHRAPEYHGRAEPQNEQGRFVGSLRQILADAHCLRELQPQGGKQDEWRRAGHGGSHVEDAQRIGRQQVVEPVTCGAEGQGSADSAEHAGIAGWRQWWGAEPDVGRVAHGVPARVDRLKSLGNAVVPQIPELIGRAILASQQSEAA